MPPKKKPTITGHAIARYIERIDPQATPDQAKMTLRGLLMEERAALHTKRRRTSAVVEGSDGFAYQHWYVPSKGPKAARYFVATNEHASVAITVLTGDMFRNLRRRVGGQKPALEESADG